MLFRRYGYCEKQIYKQVRLQRGWPVINPSLQQDVQSGAAAVVEPYALVRRIPVPYRTVPWVVRSSFDLSCR